MREALGILLTLLIIVGIIKGIMLASDYEDAQILAKQAVCKDHPEYQGKDYCMNLEAEASRILFYREVFKKKKQTKEAK